MAQVVRSIEDAVMLNGKPYTAQVCGRPNGHIWEGWVEFVDAGGSEVRRTSRETTQPDLGALVYWSQGLSPTYLEGALVRTLPGPVTVAAPMPQPYFEGPAPPPSIEIPERVAVEHAVLDPFSVATKGPDLLRKELSALRAWHLRNIVRAYDLADPSSDLDALSAPELVEMIMNAVEPV
jgi:hypothetical protein